MLIQQSEIISFEHNAEQSWKCELIKILNAVCACNKCKISPNSDVSFYHKVVSAYDLNTFGILHSFTEKECGKYFGQVLKAINYFNNNKIKMVRRRDDAKHKQPSTINC
jgi:hypothetical protein